MPTQCARESIKIQALVLAASRAMNSIVEEFAAMLRITCSLPPANPSFRKIARPKDPTSSTVFNVNPVTSY